MPAESKVPSSRFLILTAALFILPALFLAPTSTGADEKQSKTAIPIRSAAEIDYPPFSIVDADGRSDGFAVELLRAALAAMGREVNFRTGPWADVRGWLENGQVQALPLVGRTPEREPVFDFTFPYMTLHGAIVVRRDTTDIRTMQDLRGRTVAVMKGDNAEEFLRREDRGITIHTPSTFEEALHELSRGRHDAVVTQRLVALRLIQQAGITNLRVIDRPIEGFRQDFCFAVREGDRDTLGLLNEGLALVMADGTYRRLHAKWFAALQLPADRRIVVGGDHNYPPYEYLDQNGRPAGYNVDLTRAIALELGLDIEIRLGPWADIVQGLEEGDIDVIQGMFYSPKRDLTFDFTQAHAQNHYVGVVRKGEGPPPDSLEALKNQRIVIQKGDLIHQLLLEKGLDDQITTVESQEEVLEELAAGKHDCALVVRISALHLLEKNAWTNLAMGRKPIFSTDYGYAVLNGRKALLTAFGEGLEILNKTGCWRTTPWM
jgi:two-component system sensor histidine kinase EvgS